MLALAVPASAVANSSESISQQPTAPSDSPAGPHANAANGATPEERSTPPPPPAGPHPTGAQEPPPPPPVLPPAGVIPDWKNHPQAAYLPGPPSRAWVHIPTAIPSCSLAQLNHKPASRESRRAAASSRRQSMGACCTSTPVTSASPPPQSSASFPCRHPLGSCRHPCRFSCPCHHTESRISHSTSAQATCHVICPVHPNDQPHRPNSSRPRHCARPFSRPSSAPSPLPSSRTLVHATAMGPTSLRPTSNLPHAHTPSPNSTYMHDASRLEFASFRPTAQRFGASHRPHWACRRHSGLPHVAAVAPKDGPKTGPGSIVDGLVIKAPPSVANAFHQNSLPPLPTVPKQAPQISEAAAKNVILKAPPALVQDSLTTEGVDEEQEEENIALFALLSGAYPDLDGSEICALVTSPSLRRELQLRAFRAAELRDG